MIKIEIKKYIKVIILIYILGQALVSSCYGMDLIIEQGDNIGINKYLGDANKYIEKEYDLDLNNIFTSMLKSENTYKGKILNKILNILGRETKDNIKLIIKILVIVLISALITNLSASFNKSSVSNIAFFTIYTSIIVLVMSSFNSILQILTNYLEYIKGFMYSTIPILFTLTVATGAITTTSIFQPILLFTINAVNILITNILIPCVLVFTVLNIVSNLTKKEQLNKLAGLIKSLTIWALGLSLTIVIVIMSLEGSLSSSIDGVTVKTTKAAVTNFIPVVGKILGDATDTVLGSIVVLKNGIGIIGALVILLISIGPIIKIAILMGLYYLTSAVIEPVADTRIVKCIGYVGDSLKLLLAISLSIACLYIVLITLIIKISNFSVF